MDDARRAAGRPAAAGNCGGSTLWRLDTVARLRHAGSGELPMLLMLVACAASDKAPAPTGTPPAWDRPAAPIACAPGGDAPLLEEALADAGHPRAELGYTDAQWTQWDTEWNLDNPFEMSWFSTTHHAPEALPCLAGQLTADLDAAGQSAHPVAGLLTVLATWSDAALSGEPIDPAGRSLNEALEVLLAETGDTAELSAVNTLDPTLAEALVPIVLAVADAVRARYALDDQARAFGWEPELLFDAAPGLVLPLGPTAFPDPGDARQLLLFTDWYLSDIGPRSLADAARRISFAIEDADLGRFAGRSDTLDIETSAGRLRISPANDDSWDTTAGPMLLHLDLGGDDTHRDGAGATANADQPVSVLIDLGGDDQYGYDEVPHTLDRPGILASDAGGRDDHEGYTASSSETGRQGSGRYGIGILYDLGGGDDTYTSLRMSQGFGALGVGVLADDGGDDQYQAEAGSQGAGVWGLGLQYDGGGDDTYRTWAYSQGFGFVGSGGLVYDTAGDDQWWADPGNDYGGTTLFPSPQLESGQGNTSFTQGAGYGFRGEPWGVYLAGGLGVLRDAAGADRYTAGVFAQGSGFWQGTGVLADSAGDDQYDALWYAQGSATHFAMAIQVDAAGNDQYNPSFSPLSATLGAGHDYSVGMFIDESGDDTYHSNELALGASNCQGIGVFVDNDGSDTYLPGSTYSTGLGNHSTQCDAGSGRTGTPSQALFLDGGGDPDAWVWPADDVRLPADDSWFGIAWSGGSDERGGAVDGDGETGLHVWGVVP